MAETSGSYPEGDKSSSFGSLKIVLVLFGIAFIINGLGNGVFSAVMRPYVMFNLQASATEFGLVSSLGFGLVTAIVQIPGGKLADKFGRKPLVLSSLLVVPFILALGFAVNIWQFVLIVGMVCTVGNISSPAVDAWLMDSVPKSKRASVSGIVNTINGVGMVVGPIIGSYLWNSIGAIISFAATGLIFSFQLLPYLKMRETQVKG